MSSDIKHNAEGYKDSTAYRAIMSVSAEKRKQNHPRPGADRRAAKDRRQHQPDCKAYQQYRDCVRAGLGGHQGGAGSE